MWYAILFVAVFALVGCAIRTLWWFDRRRDRRAWEKLVKDREGYVEDGCPIWEYSEYGALRRRYDPFRGTYSEIGGFERFPDLVERNKIAGMRRQLIREEQRAIGYEKCLPPFVGLPGKTIYYCSPATDRAMGLDVAGLVLALGRDGYPRRPGAQQGASGDK